VLFEALPADMRSDEKLAQYAMEHYNRAVYR
jgi:hypothetical protein